MGLIIHPSSCCDVCLEFFTYDEPKPPHAIPCGHIFCKDCLHTVNPRNCPLCRKAFIPERSKKLITGELPPSDGVNEIDLLKRLAISWDLQEEQLVVVTTEVDTWLRGREETATILPLRKALDSLRTYHRLKTQTDDDRRTIRHLKREIRATIDDKNTANAVGQSLISQIEELHTKVSTYETEIQNLREEIGKFQYTGRNPLPAPPEPVSLDRVPTLAQTAPAGPSSYMWRPTDTISSSDESVYHSYLSEGESSHYNSREPRVKGTDRKGKGKARDDRERPAYDIYRSPSLAPRSNTTVNGTAATTMNNNRNAIIPGATPNQRVIPMRKTAFEDINIQTATGYMTPPELRDQGPVGIDPSQYVDPYTVTAEFVSGYPDGFMAGYQAGLNPLSGEVNDAYSYSTWGGAEGVQSTMQEPPLGSNNRSSRLPRWGSEVDHSRYPTDSHYPVPPLSAPPRAEHRPAQDAGDRTRAQRIPSPLSAPAVSGSTIIAPRPSVMGGPGLLWEERSGSASRPAHLAASPASSSTTSTQSLDAEHENVRPYSHRRRTVQVDGNMTEHEVQASDQPTVRRSQLRRRSAMSARTDPPAANGTAQDVNTRGPLDTAHARNSFSSWGTVDSENPPISVSDLPVHTDFSRGAGGSMHSLSSLVPYGSSLNGVSEQVNGGGTVDRSHETPRVGVASLSRSVSSVHPLSISRAAERPRDRRDASNPPIRPPSTENSRYHSEVPPAHTSLSYRDNTPEYFAFGRLPVDSSSDDDDSLGTRWADASRSTDDPLSLSGNALGLHLSRSSDNVLGLHLNQSPQISAPTPIIPSRAFLRSFSHDGYY